MERLQYPLSHEWHAAVNRHIDARHAAGNEWRKTRFMYDAKTMADEVPRMVMLFRQEREGALPQTRQQCSMQPPRASEGQPPDLLQGLEHASVSAPAGAGQDRALHARRRGHREGLDLRGAHRQHRRRHDGRGLPAARQ